MFDEFLVIDDWLMVLLVGIDVNIPVTRPSGDDVVVADLEMFLLHEVGELLMLY